MSSTSDMILFMCCCDNSHVLNCTLKDKEKRDWIRFKHRLWCWNGWEKGKIMIILRVSHPGIMVQTDQCKQSINLGYSSKWIECFVWLNFSCQDVNFFKRPSGLLSLNNPLSGFFLLKPVEVFRYEMEVNAVGWETLMDSCKVAAVERKPIFIYNLCLTRQEQHHVNFNQWFNALVWVSVSLSLLSAYS